jgi:NAD+ diphosphatase
MSHPQTQKRVLALLTTTDVMPLLSPEPFFGQGEGERQINDSAEHPALESARHRGTPIVFLGLLEPNTATDKVFLSSDFKDPLAANANLNGVPYFTLDVADLEPAKVDSVLRNPQSIKDGETLVWTDPKVMIAHLDHSIAGVFAQASMMADWNRRNKVS